MITIVIGASASGKSEYAEKLALESNKLHKFYIATMQVFDEEGKARVEKHRKMRSGKGFETIEKPNNISEINEHENSVYLLECMGNLAMNELFESGNIDVAFKNIMHGINCLLSCNSDVIIVTNDVFSDGIKYNGFTEKYIDLLAKINLYIGNIAENIVEVVCGIPIFHKGVRYENS